MDLENNNQQTDLMANNARTVLQTIDNTAPALVADNAGTELHAPPKLIVEVRMLTNLCALNSRQTPCALYLVLAMYITSVILCIVIAALFITNSIWFGVLYILCTCMCMTRLYFLVSASSFEAL